MTGDYYTSDHGLLVCELANLWYMMYVFLLGAFYKSEQCINCAAHYINPYTLYMV